MRGGFEILAISSKDIEKFFSYGAHFIKFGLDCTHIYDLMFDNIELDSSHYHDLKARTSASFDGLVERLKSFLPDLMRKGKIL